MKKQLCIMVCCAAVLNAKAVTDTEKPLLNYYNEFKNKKQTTSFDFSLNPDDAERAINKLKTNDLHKNLLRYLYNTLNNAKLVFSKKNIMGKVKTISEKEFLQEFNEAIANEYRPQIVTFNLEEKINKARETIKDKLLLTIYFDALQNQYLTSFIQQPKTQKGVFNIAINQANPVESVNSIVFNNELKKLLEKKKESKKEQEIETEKIIIIKNEPKEAVEKNKAAEQFKKEQILEKRLEKTRKIIEKLKKQLEKDTVKLQEKQSPKFDTKEQRMHDVEAMPDLRGVFEEKDEELDKILDEALDYYEEFENKSKNN